MSESSKTVFTKRISAGKGRNYYVDVRQSEKNGKKYLVISESRNIEGNWSNHRLMLFPEHVPAWKKTLEEALQHLD
jgi:hypothetical protein